MAGNEVKREKTGRTKKMKEKLRVTDRGGRRKRKGERLEKDVSVW